MGAADGRLQGPGGPRPAARPHRALYATLVVLTQLAVLAKDGASVARMAEIIVAYVPPPHNRPRRTDQVFTFYPAKDDMVVLAKMVKKGMKGGRTSADVTLLLTELEKKGVGVPAAAYGQGPPSVFLVDRLRGNPADCVPDGFERPNRRADG